MGDSTEAKKFKNTFEISYEDYMMARFQPMVGVIKKFISEFGEEKTLQLVSEYFEELSVSQIQQLTESKSIKNFAQFKIVLMEMMNSEFMKNTTTYSIINDTDKVLELRFSKCLWANAMRKLGFDGEMGYMTICRVDHAMATAFHPSIRLSRTKTLMQGHEYCNYCYTWEDN